MMSINKKLVLVVLFSVSTLHQSTNALPAWAHTAYTTLAHWCSATLTSAQEEYKKATCALVGLSLCTIIARLVAHTIKKRADDAQEQLNNAPKKIAQKKEATATLKKELEDRASRDAQTRQNIRAKKNEAAALKKQADEHRELTRKYEYNAQLQKENEEMEKQIDQKNAEDRTLKDQMHPKNFLKNYHYWKQQATAEMTDEKNSK